MNTIVSLSTCVLLIISTLPESKAQTNGTQEGNATQSEGISSLFNFIDIFDEQRVQEATQVIIDAVAENPVVSQIRNTWTAAGDAISGVARQVWQSFLGNDTSVSRRSIREAASKFRVNVRT